MDADGLDTLPAVEILAKKMDTVLTKLQKLDNIVSRLDNLFKAVSNIEDTIASLDKEVHDLKEKGKKKKKKRQRNSKIALTSTMRKLPT